MSLPVFIPTRDRVSDLRRLVAWLERAGLDRITFLDNASTWPPLLDYLADTPHEVFDLAQNFGSQALWHAGFLPDEPFLYTDPDVLPHEDCPLDAANHLAGLLERFPMASKAALGLYLEDVPAGMPSMAWERSLMAPERQIAPGVYETLSDTTFAVYRANAPFTLQALRTGAPYLARHMPWYLRELDEEHSYYMQHAKHGPEGTNLTGLNSSI